MPASRSRNTPDPHSGRFPPSQPRPQRPPAQTRAIGGTLFLCSFACSFSSCFARKAPVLGSVCAPRGPSVPLFFVRPEGPRFRWFVCAPRWPSVPLVRLCAQMALGSFVLCSPRGHPVLCSFVRPEGTRFFVLLFFCSFVLCSLFFRPYSTCWPSQASYSRSSVSRSTPKTSCSFWGAICCARPLIAVSIAALSPSRGSEPLIASKGRSANES
jgi:hypothetical protein